MAAQKYSICLVLFISACMHSGLPAKVNITNQAEGCVTFSVQKTEGDAPVILNLKVRHGNIEQPCSCRSALLRYNTSQTKERSTFNLLSGSFSAFNKASVALPVAVQSQLVYWDRPLDVHISCETPQ